ncbi:hypothetical protein [Streptomyces montanisoli]|uniref:Lipoprotein CseA n=1 Tax=Streptomyces montanisoli TaxID=2798581 RepID=A0A940MHI4_9ACTN|nr:hypothetical protein [Streptomyces montanisoli]MBP0461192.1 hypothetical protein [Streptomyces montanisoli]
MRSLRSRRPSPGGGGGSGEAGAAVSTDGRPFGDSGAACRTAPHGRSEASGRRPRRTARVFAAGGSTVAGLAGLATIGLLAGGCSAGGTGMRDEGPAVPAPVERTMPTPSQSPRPTARSVDPVALLRADPRVSEKIKDGLKPCGADSYPVNTSYGDLTGGSRPDLVINVTTCKDSIGIGTYVYRATGDGGGAATSGATSTTPSSATSGAGASRSAGAHSSGGPKPGESVEPLLRKKQPPLPGKYENVFTSEEPSVYAAIDRGELVVTQQVYGKGDSVAYPSGEEVVTYDWTNSKFVERYRVRNTYSKPVDGDDDLGDSAPTPAPSG